MTVIDFNSMVNKDFGKEGLFVDNYFPQKIYYQRLVGILEEEMKKIGRISKKN